MNETGKNPPGATRAGGDVGGPAPVPAPAVENSREATLGAFITAARERRGVTREAATKETRIPAHYIAMIESDSYAAISDQLYVLPFMRRYAEFLGLDAEEIAIRFVREVQRAESNVVKISEPIVDRRRGRNPPWIWIVAVITVVIVAAALYLKNHRSWMLFRSESTVSSEPVKGAFDDKSNAAATAPAAVPAQPPANAAPSIPPKAAVNERPAPDYGQ